MNNHVPLTTAYMKPLDTLNPKQTETLDKITHQYHLPEFPFYFTVHIQGEKNRKKKKNRWDIKPFPVLKRRITKGPNEEKNWAHPLHLSLQDN
jgi:hypothetical protein